MNKLEKYNSNQENMYFRNYDYVIVTHQDFLSTKTYENQYKVAAYNRLDLLIHSVFKEVGDSKIERYFIHIYILNDIFDNFDAYRDGLVMEDNVLVVDLSKCSECLTYVDKVELDVSILKAVLDGENMSPDNKSFIRNEELDIFNKHSNEKLSYYNKSSATLIYEVMNEYREIATQLILSMCMYDYYMLMFGNEPISYLFFSVKDAVRIFDYYAVNSNHAAIYSVYMILLDTIARENGLTTIHSLTNNFKFENGEFSKQIATFKKKHIEPYVTNTIKVDTIPKDKLSEDDIVINTIFVGAKAVFNAKYKFRSNGNVVYDGSSIQADYLTPSVLKYNKQYQINVISGVREIFSTFCLHLDRYARNFQEAKLDDVIDSIEMLATFFHCKITSKKDIDKKTKDLVLESIDAMKTYLERYVKNLSIHFNIPSNENNKNKTSIFYDICRKIDKHLFNSVHTGIMEEMRGLWEEITQLLIMQLEKHSKTRTSEISEKSRKLSNNLMLWINDDAGECAFNKEQQLIELMVSSRSLVFFLLEKINKNIDDYDTITSMSEKLSKEENKTLKWRYRHEKELKSIFKTNKLVYDENISLIENIYKIMSIEKDSETVLFGILCDCFNKIKMEMKVLIDIWKEHQDVLRLFVKKYRHLSKEDGFDQYSFVSHKDELTCAKTTKNKIILQSLDPDNSEDIAKAFDKREPESWIAIVNKTYEKYRLDCEGRHYESLKSYATSPDDYIQYVSSFIAMLKNINVYNSYIDKDRDFLHIVLKILILYKMKNLSIKRLHEVIKKEILILAKKYDFLIDDNVLVKNIDKFESHGNSISTVILENALIGIDRQIHSTSDLMSIFFLFCLLNTIRILLDDVPDGKIATNLALYISWHCAKIIEFYKDDDSANDEMANIYKELYIERKMEGRIGNASLMNFKN